LVVFPRVKTGLQWRRNEFESGVHTSDAKRRKKFLSYPSTFFGCTSTVSRLAEHFRDGQYSLISFWLAVLLLTVSPV